MYFPCCAREGLTLAYTCCFGKWSREVVDTDLTGFPSAAPGPEEI